MTLSRLVIGLLATVALAGCIPSLYQWSPDGKWMTVLLPNGGLRLADASGHLLPAAIPDAKVVAWFGDSQRVVASREIHISKWDELTHYLTPTQANQIADAGERVRQALMVYDWTKADSNTWDKFTSQYVTEEQQAKHDTLIDREFAAAIGVYLHDNADAALREAIPGPRWAELTQIAQSIFTVGVYTISPSGAEPGAKLLVSLKAIDELRVSPNGRAVIIMREDVNPDQKTLDLLVAPTDGRRPPILISGQAAWYPDWSPDGNWVTYIAQIAAKQTQGVSLGSLSRARLAWNNGKLLDAPSEREELTGLVFDPYSRVRCLKDGRIVFSAVAVSLPATSQDLPQRRELFAVEPGKQATVARLLPRRTAYEAGDAAQYFEISPGGAMASIPDQDGRVSVVDLASGDVTQVQDQPFKSKDKNDKLTLPTVPAWRSADELTFMTPTAGGGKSVVLWSMSKKEGRVLSENWPAGTIDAPPTAQP